jgi:hypothetical protein
MSSNVLSFPDRLTGRRVSLALVAHGKLLSPAQLRAQIKHPLELIKADAYLFAQRSPRCKHGRRRQEALPPIGSIFVDYPPCVPVPVMFRCVAFACHRLATAPVNMYMVYMYKMWGWAEVMMERVTRGRVKRVQVRLQRRVCCAVLFACRASVCVRCVFDVCCRKRWLIFRCVASHGSGCIKRAAVFILVCRLPLRCRQTPTLWTRQDMETALRCFAI